LERKQATHPDLLCRGYPSEFKDYFAHCSALGFEDRPDYRYLKRIFKDLFERQGLEDDGVYDWDVLKRHQEGAAPQASLAPVGMATDGPNDDDNDDTKGTGQDLSGAPTATAAAAVSARSTGGAQQNPSDAAKGSNRGQDEAEQGAQPPLRSIISSIRFVISSKSQPPLLPTNHSFHHNHHRHSLFGSSKTGSNGGQSGRTPR